MKLVFLGIEYEKYTASLDSSPLTRNLWNRLTLKKLLIWQHTFLFERSVRRQAIPSIDKAEVEMG